MQLYPGPGPARHLVLFYLGTAASLGELEKECEVILGFPIFCGTLKLLSGVASISSASLSGHF